MKTVYIVTYIIVRMTLVWGSPPPPVLDEFGRNLSPIIPTLSISVDSIPMKKEFTLKKEADAFVARGKAANEAREKVAKSDSGRVNYETDPGKLLNFKVTTVRK